MSQAEPLPFVETGEVLAGAHPATLPDVRPSRAARLGIRFTIVLLLAFGLGVFAAWEMRTFGFEAYLFHNAARNATFAVSAGPATWDLPDPAGPYDRRMGYTGLRRNVERLDAAGFDVVGQARSTGSLARIAHLGLFPPYSEKPQAGLRITGRTGAPLFEAAHPGRAYAGFEDVPPLLVESLLFIENRELLDQATPHRNPAVEWDRLAKAVWSATGGGPGGSTLATQIEKFRHSPEGITSSPREKLRQMLSASLRAYRAGDVTTDARRQIVVDYLNGVPLSAVPGGGEVIGLGDGLAAWYGASFEETNRLLTPPLRLDGPDREKIARAYVLALSLFVAQRRPTTLLLEHPQELTAQTRAHLPLLAKAGVISVELRDAALEIDFVPAGAPEPERDDQLARRRAGPVRARLAGLLGTRGFYELDRIDLGVESTLDLRAQDLLGERVDRFSDPEAAAAAGLLGVRLLEPGTEGGVEFSLNLYERGTDAHRLRAQVDNSDGALDLSDGVKLDLGSTAKLRTIVTYLEILAGLHERYSALPRAALVELRVPPSDRLAQFVQEQLLAKPSLTLTELLDASLERRYSASPYTTFFTGGGEHRFSNFDKADNGRILTVRVAFQRSVNLVFIRLMRDVVDHIMSSQLESDTIFAAPHDDSRRRAYLWLFAHAEGGVYIAKAYSRFAALPPDAALAKLYERRKPSPKAVAAAIRSVDPDVDLAVFTERLAALLPSFDELPADLVPKLYAQSDPKRWTLQDRGYVAKVHPLELWVLSYLREHPDATLAELLDASRGERLDAYRWLFRPSRRFAQNRRIRTMLERVAFERIHEQWQSTGYPFPSLVPSLATALGTSADRPTSLAELMGIVASDGVRVPIRRIESLRFAADTPYETLLAPTPAQPERVLRPEVCAVVQRALWSTVEGGTAARARGALHHADGSLARVGGKTGTGDHRYKVMARDQRVLEERPVSRAAVFTFLIDDRYFGVLTAVVTGPEAGRYSFTSSLPVQIFTALMPEVLPVLEADAAEQVALAGPRN